MKKFIWLLFFQMVQGQLQTLVGSPGVDLDASLIIYLEPDSAQSGALVDGTSVSNWKNLAAPPADVFHSFVVFGTFPPIFVRKSDGVPWIAHEFSRGHSFRMSMAGDFDDYLTILDAFTLHMAIYTIFRATNAVLFEIEENPYVPGSGISMRRKGDTDDLFIVVGKASFAVENFFMSDSARILAVRMSASSKTLEVSINGNMVKQFANVEPLPNVARYKLTIGQNSSSLFGTVAFHNRALASSEMTSLSGYIESKFLAAYVGPYTLLGPSIDFSQVIRAHPSVQSPNLVGLDFSTSLIMYLSTASLPLSPLIRWPNHADSTWALNGRGLSMDYPSVVTIGTNKMVQFRRDRAQYYRILPPDANILSLWTGLSFTFVARVSSEAAMDAIFGERILELKNQDLNAGTIWVGRYNNTKGYGLNMPTGRWTGGSWNARLTAVYTVNMVGTTVTFWKNGVLTSSLTGLAIPSIRRFTQNFLGAGSAGASFDGAIGDVLLYKRGLLNAELIAVHTYMTSLYNLFGSPSSTKVRYVELIPPKTLDFWNSIVVSTISAVNSTNSLFFALDTRNQSLLSIRNSYPTSTVVEFPGELDIFAGLRLQLDSIFVPGTALVVYDGLGKITRRATLNQGIRFLGGSMFTFAVSFNGAITLTPDSGVIPFSNSLFAYYDSFSWNPSSAVWIDKSGNGRHGIVAAGFSPPALSTDSLFDSIGSICLAGGTSQGVRFATMDLSVGGYTLLSRARYNGPAKTRIFDGIEANFLSGFFSGRSGLAHHNAWITDQINFYGDSWVTSVDTWTSYRGNGVTTSRYGAGTKPGALTITINSGAFLNERSDWQVSEVALFSREMNMTETIILENWIASKYQSFGTRTPGDGTNNQTRYIRVFSSTRKTLFLADIEVVTLAGQQIISKQNTSSTMSSFSLPATNSPNQCIDGNFSTFCIVPANTLITEFILFDLGASFDIANISLYPPLSNFLGLMENPVVQTISVDGTLLSTSIIPVTNSSSKIAISFPFFPNGTLVPVSVPDSAAANALVRYIYIRGSAVLSFDQVNVFSGAQRVKANLMDATFSSQWAGTVDVKPSTAANCIKDFIDGGCSSDFISGAPSLMVIDLGRPVNVSIVEILNRKDFFESRLQTGNAQVEFYTVFGSRLLTSTAASISYNVTVHGPGFVPVIGDGVRFFKIQARPNIGIALAEFSIQTFDGQQIRIASVTKSSVAVSDGQTWNCVDNDIRSDCLTGSGASEWMLFDLGMSFPLEVIQKIVVVNRAGVGAKDTLSGLALQFLNGDLVFLSSYTFASDIREVYVFPETCDFGSSFSFSGCSPCPVGTYKNRVGDTGCNACPLRNGIQTVTVESGSTSLGACVCPGGFTAPTPGSCVACAVNTFRSLSNSVSSCAVCPPGSSTGNTTAQTTCAFCAAGFAGKLGVTSCRPCGNCSLALSDNSPPVVPITTTTIAVIATGVTAPTPTMVAIALLSSDLSTLVIVAISAGSLACVSLLAGGVFYALKKHALKPKQDAPQLSPLFVPPFYYQPTAMNSMGWNRTATPLIMTNDSFLTFPMAASTLFPSPFPNTGFTTISNMDGASMHTQSATLMQHNTINFRTITAMPSIGANIMSQGTRFVPNSLHQPTGAMPSASANSMGQNKRFVTNSMHRPT